MWPAVDTQRWQDPQWLQSARAWILERVGPAPAIEQTHVYPWATVLRVGTERGPVWFKAVAASLRHEVGLTQLIAARRPDLVPPLLAADTERGWLLMADAGETLGAVCGREGSLDRWHDVLRRYAQLQLDLAGDVPDLLALGVPDRRLATLPAGYERLIDGLAQRGADVVSLQAAAAVVAALCDELASYGLPELLQHDDLHDGQVYVRDAGTAVLDWGDACVSHPFFTLSVTLDGVLSWGLDDIQDSVDVTSFRDAYLEPFSRRCSGDLVRASTVARRLGWVCRAVNGHVPGDDEKTLTRLRMFLPA